MKFCEGSLGISPSKQEKEKSESKKETSKNGEELRMTYKRIENT